MKNNIFFDFDDTIISTKSRQYKVFQLLFKQLQITNNFSEEEFWNLKRSGQSSLDLLSTIDNNKKKLFKKEWLKLIEEKKYLKYDKLIPNLKKILKNLSKNNNIYLLSCRQKRKNLIWELNQLTLKNYFKDIIISSPIDREKGKINQIKKIINKKNKNYLIGDTEVDILAARSFDFPCLSVTWGIRSADFLEKFSPDYLINQPDEILKLIK